MGVKVNVTCRQVEISAERKDASKERSKDHIKHERLVLGYRKDPS